MISNPSAGMAKLLYLGLPKTGSTSLAKLMANFFTVSHEFDHINACEKIWDKNNSKQSYQIFTNYFHDREQLFECDIATFTHQSAQEVCKIYKSSVYLAIIRKPADWAASFISMISREADNHDKQPNLYRNFCQAYCRSISNHISYRGFQFQILLANYRQLIITDFLLYYNKYLDSLREIADVYPDRLYIYEFNNFYENSYAKFLLKLTTKSCHEEIFCIHNKKIPFLNKSSSDPRFINGIIKDIEANDLYVSSLSLYTSILTDFEFTYG